MIVLVIIILGLVFGIGLEIMYPSQHNNYDNNDAEGEY